MPVSARRAALQALLRYEKNGAWPLDTLEAILQREKPEPREAALARRICLTVMQNTTLLDAWIDRYSATPCRLLDREVACILRLSAAQILLMTKIPAHAAVSEGVALCRTCGKKSAAGLVNAVLRRLSGEKGTLPPLPEEETERLSVLYSHPL